MIGFKEKDISININKVVYDLGQINMIRDTIKIDGVNVSAHTEIQLKVSLQAFTLQVTGTILTYNHH